MAFDKPFPSRDEAERWLAFKDGFGCKTVITPHEHNYDLRNVVHGFDKDGTHVKQQLTATIPKTEAGDIAFVALANKARELWETLDTSRSDDDDS